MSPRLIRREAQFRIACAFKKKVFFEGLDRQLVGLVGDPYLKPKNANCLKTGSLRMVVLNMNSTGQSAQFCPVAQRRNSSWASRRSGFRSVNVGSVKHGSLALLFRRLFSIALQQRRHGRILNSEPGC